MERTGILPESPLILAVASVRFTPWPMLSKKIEEIAEELRIVLPLFQPLVLQQERSQGNTQFDAIPIWMLMTADRSAAVQLSHGQILVISSRYTDFAEFSNLISKVVSAFFNRMKFVDCTSMGVRYVDHIQPLSAESLGQYVHSGLLAPEFEGFARQGGNNLSFYRDGEAELRVRCVSQSGFMVIPEDLIPLMAMINKPGQQLQIPTLNLNECVLDMDALIEYETPLRINDQETILEKLTELHCISNRFFRHPHVFTDHAFNVWKIRRIL